MTQRRAYAWVYGVLALLSLACSERHGAKSRPATEPLNVPPSEIHQADTEHPGGAADDPKQVRLAQRAGSFYPADPVLAIVEMERDLRRARSAPRLPVPPRALVVPHAGWQYSGVAAAAAYRNLRGTHFPRVVLLGPAHRGAFVGFALAKFDRYRTLLGDIPLCQEASALYASGIVQDIADADRAEHSLEVQLPWLQETLEAFCILPILVGQTNAERERKLAEVLAQLPRENTLYIASSDFVHYGRRFGYTPFGDSVSMAAAKVFDLEERAIRLLRSQDAPGLRELVSSTDATICGYRGQLVLLELLRQIAPQAQAFTLAHYSSAELGEERDESGSVGYVALGFTDSDGVTGGQALRAPQAPRVCGADEALDEGWGRQLPALARATLETKLRGTDALRRAFQSLPDVPRLDCKQAVFVTLKAKGQLRGCVGQVAPTYPLFEAVTVAAVDAALSDRRFEPVTASELDGVTYEVTVLSVPEEVGSSRDIVLGKHGIILSLAGHRALFLPQVPGEQGWNLEQTLRALSHKAGLPEDAWQDSRAQFSVFTGTVFEESQTPSARGTTP